MTQQTTQAQRLLEEAFPPGRPQRSPSYKAGMLAALRFRLGESDRVRCGYREGSAEFDAFWAGSDEGHRRGREWLDAQQEAA